MECRPMSGFVTRPCQTTLLMQKFLSLATHRLLMALPRFTVPAILAVVSIFVIAMYVNTDTPQRPISDSPGIADDATAAILANSSSDVSDASSMVAYYVDADNATHYIIEASDSPTVSGD